MAITLDGTTGITTPGLTNTGTETIVNLTTTGNTILGNASTDTLNVGNGDLIKDASGNLGLGVTPSAWASGTKALQVGAQSSVWDSAGGTRLGNNYYYDSAFKYLTTDGASQYRLSSGTHIWSVAPSGTAGNAITFTQAMTLDASGNLGIGTASPASQLQIYPTSANIFTEGLRVNREGQTGQYAIVNYSGGAYNVLAVDSLFSAPAISFKTSTNGTTTTERMRIDASGNLLVGTASVGNKLSSFTNTQSSACLAQGTYITGGVLFASTYSASSSNNATVDAFLFRNSAGSTLGTAGFAGHFYVQVTGGSGANQYCAVYTILSAGNGTSTATLALVNTAQVRGTSPVSSVGIADDGVGGAIKLRITYINNGGVVDFGSSIVSFIGTTI